MTPQIVCGCGGPVDLELTRVDEAPDGNGAVKRYEGFCNRCNTGCDVQMFVSP
jgi:hypothetical protein